MDALTAPAQRHWSWHGMPHRLACRCRFKPRLFQREVPFRRPISVVDEHQRRVVLQAFRLLDHRDLVLFNKSFSEKRSDSGYKWNAIKDVPGSIYVNTARICNCRSYSCKT